MTPPALEIADLIRTAGAAFVERNRQWIRWRHVKVLLAIARCRTAALGGHLDECTRCAHRAPISYNSCRDRHCPKCQTAARERWIAARRRELLPTRYLHVVFTLPRQLAPVVLQNKKVIYDLLFRASAETLLEVARDPRHLGAEIGFFSVLHTPRHPPGIKRSGSIPISIVWCPPEVSRSITPAGCTRRTTTSCPKRYCVRSSVASSSQASGRPSRMVSCASRKVEAALRNQDLRGVAPATVSTTLGGVLETSLRRPRICAAISRSLHPSRGHLQSSLGLICRWPSDFSLAGFR